jgi:hypothetical protein
MLPFWHWDKGQRTEIDVSQLYDQWYGSCPWTVQLQGFLFHLLQFPVRLWRFFVFLQKVLMSCLSASIVPNALVS